MAAINKNVYYVAANVYYCLQVDKWSNQNEKIRINNHRPRGYRLRRVICGDGVMSNYTIEDLCGKYVKAGTPEADVFLDACEALGVVWFGDKVKPRDSHDKSRLGAILTVYNDGEDSLSWQVDRDTTDTRGNRLQMFTPKPQWTIHNNTLPLRELSDEQYGKLRRAADAGGMVDSLDAASGEWIALNEPRWADGTAYRIKPKSERDEFVERFFEHYDGGTLYDNAIERMISAAFDAGCRFVENDK